MGFAELILLHGLEVLLDETSGLLVVMLADSYCDHDSRPQKYDKLSSCRHSKDIVDIRRTVVFFTCLSRLLTPFA